MGLGILIFKKFAFWGTNPMGNGVGKIWRKLNKRPILMKVKDSVLFHIRMKSLIMPLYILWHYSQWLHCWNV